jgi:hypothetical protein
MGDRCSEKGIGVLKWDRHFENGGQGILKMGDRRSEKWDRSSEIGDRRSEIGNTRSEIGNRRSEIGDRCSEIGDGRLRSEIGDS